MNTLIIRKKAQAPQTGYSKRMFDGIADYQNPLAYLHSNKVKYLPYALGLAGAAAGGAVGYRKGGGLKRSLLMALVGAGAAAGGGALYNKYIHKPNDLAKKWDSRNNK